MPEETPGEQTPKSEPSASASSASNGKSDIAATVDTVKSWWLRRGWGWIQRVFFIGIYGVLTWFALWAVGILVLIQVVVALVLGKPNNEAVAFSKRLATFIKECIAYVTWAEDEKPFPMKPFPEA